MTHCNIYTVLDADLSAGDVLISQHGVGSIYTYLASGASGQTASVQGSIDGVLWVDIVALTVGAAPDSIALQHTWPHLRATGSARLQIARGAA